MGSYRNVSTLEGIDVVDRSAPNSRRAGVVLDAEWAEPRDSIEACRRCGTPDPKLYRHGWSSVKINDTPWSGRPLGIRLRKQRYKCQECGRTFVSTHPDVHEEYNMSCELVRYIKARGLKEAQVKNFARRLGLGEGTVWNVLDERIETINNAIPPSPERILGIDEVHMPTGERHTVFTDLWKGTILELLESNKKPDVAEALREITPIAQLNPDVQVPDRFGSWENWGIVAVVMDMDTRYRDLVHEIIPRAKVIVDRFHVIDKANDALTEVRKRAAAKKDEEIRERRAARGMPEPKQSYVTRWKRQKDVFKKRWDSLQSHEQFRLEQDLKQLPELRDAYFAFDRFKQIFDHSRPAKADEALRKWERNLPESVREVFEKKLLRAVNEWREEILNYFWFIYKYTNAGTEGLNRAIKQISAEGSGYSSFRVLKAKVMERFGERMKTRVEERTGTSIFRGNASSDRR